MSGLEAILYPQLGAFPSEERDRALARARRTPFDVVELVGMALAAIVAVAVSRNNVLAAPLLVVLVGPFLVRRVRRGLDSEYEKLART